MRWLLLLCLVASGAGAAPVVIETQPPNGARDVDPATGFIRVVFSEPMSRSSWSWCGGGYPFPAINGSPFWEDERTALLPVTLEPQHSYMLSINCPSARGFVSAKGEEATPHPLRFVTGWGDPLTASTDANNLAAVQMLRQLLDERYSYADRLGWNWRAALEEEKPFLLASPNATEWALRALPFLARFEDKHLLLVLPDGESLKPWRPAVFYNANDDAIRALLGPLTVHQDVGASARIDGIGYLRLDSWSGEEEHEKIMHTLLDSMLDTRVLILDMRGNGGGDEIYARRLAARFLVSGEGGIYARHRLRDPDSPGGWTDWRERHIRPAENHSRYLGRVLLLQGQVCLSSNESFIKMMRLSPRVTTLGATTGGSSALPQRHTLPNGIEISLATWWSTLPDRSPLEGIGIPPQIPVGGDFATSDPVLEKALELAKTPEKPAQ